MSALAAGGRWQLERSVGHYVWMTVEGLISILNLTLLMAD